MVGITFMVFITFMGDTAPYSIMITCALSTKAQVTCARSKENVSVFDTL